MKSYYISLNRRLRSFSSGKEQKGRTFYWLIITYVIYFILSANYLPMNDLPQLAAQVSTLNDLIKGESPWVNLVEYNWFTPYLTCYILWLVLYQCFDIVLSSRILVAFTFFLFAYAFSRLRSSYQAEKIVDWIVIPSFFSFAYYYGFITFLLAIPLGILYFLSFKRWLLFTSNKNFLILLGLGVLTFFSHILSFLFFVLLSFIHLLFMRGKLSYKYISPFLIFSILLGVYLSFPDKLGNQYSYGENKWNSLLTKSIELLSTSFTLFTYTPLIYFSISSIFLVLPFFMGYRLSRTTERYIPLFVFLICWLSLPLLFNNIYFIYNRYSLIFFGFYYLIFEKIGVADRKNLILSFKVLFSFLIGFLLLKNQLNVLAMNQETKSFSKFIAQLPESKRVASLPFNNSSKRIDSYYTFVHFPLWYQAQKKGWVDYNFAWASPQIVRFKPNATPELGPGSEWDLSSFLHLQDCNYYDLLIVRHPDKLWVDNFISKAHCGASFKYAYNEGEWIAYYNVSESTQE